MPDILAALRALLAAAVLRVLTNALPKPPEAPPMPDNDILRRALAARPPTPDTLEMYRSDIEAGLWNRWYDGEDIGMDAPVGGLMWARRLSYEQVEGLVRRIREEYGG